MNSTIFRTCLSVYLVFIGFEAWANSRVASSKLLVLPPKTFSRIEGHRAKAYLEKGRKKLIYSEEHRAFYGKTGLIKTENDYFNTQKQKIAELNSDYTESTTLPSYTFYDLRTGDKRGGRWVKGNYFIFRQKRNEAEESKKIDDLANLYSGQGWHYYLVSQLDGIAQKNISLRLVLPARLDDFTLRLTPLNQKKNITTLRLEFDSWFMRLFAPHLDLVYDQDSKKLIEYYGPSNILDEKGQTQNVHIFYEAKATRKLTP